DFLDRFADAHAALAVGIVLEAALAAAAGMDLRLHDSDGAAELAGHVHRLVPGVGDRAPEDGDGEFGQLGLGLVFVDVHAVLLRWPVSKKRAQHMGCKTQLTSGCSTLWMPTRLGNDGLVT